jgi:hypothetical protein
MAEAWQGVLLIDEADVYLQQRAMGNSVKKYTIVAGKHQAFETFATITLSHFCCL